ncbi:SDR family oxidoreductase [Actinocrispum wychmicini]|nr:SDR family oxidoreductase [Actinocrispum wychmicini]
MATYLVTGATGLIGRHFVQRLLARTDLERIWLVVRAGSQDKLARLVRTWPAPQRVTMVVGDIAEAGLGISERDLSTLRGRVDHIVHLAALYDVTADDEESVAANVDGTRHVIELAEDIEAGCLHHVSSVAVAGDHEGVFTPDMFDVGQRLVTAYHRTKFESERLVREQETVPWRVYRPAIVVGHSVTGEMDKVDGPYYFFPALSRLAALPHVPVVAPDIGDTNIVPVDYVADALTRLVNSPGLDGRTFHLVNPKPQSARSVYDAFARAAGAPGITWELDSRVSRPLVSLAKLSEYVPGFTLARDAVLDRLGIPPVVLSALTFPAQFTPSPVDGVAVPELESYADVLWRYWREHLDPFRARRGGRHGSLDGRRVVITGASSGIGRATATKVAAAGGIPLLVARRAAELEELRSEIQASGGHAYVYPCDLTDAESVDKAVTAMLEEHPDGIDMLVNNAGRSIRRSIRLSYDRFHDYERAMAINYFGAVRLILALLPHMAARRFGHIVNVSSIGVQGIAPRFSAYVASKAALDYFSRIAATETHGAGVTFTTVHMPLVRTPMIRPTKLYDAFPAKSPDQAADMVIEALRDRPKQVGTPTGLIIQVAYALAPGLVDAVAYQGYRVFPDSTAAGGGGKAKLGKGERQLSAAAAALMRLTRGFHW